MLHCLFWFLILFLICFVNSMVFNESGFKKTTILSSICYLFLVILGHYLFCRIITFNPNIHNFVLGGFLILIYYVSFCFLSPMILLITSKLDGSNNYIIALYSYYEINSWTEVFTRKQFGQLFSFVLVYNIIAIAIKIGIDYFEVQQEAYLIAKERNRIESAFLRTQIHPRFLLHTLHDIQENIDPNHDAAKVIKQLSRLMKFSLFDAQKKQITLLEEVRFLQNYIELEKIRHRSGRVQILADFSKISDQKKVIAPLLLVNFLENAIKHGVNATTRNAYINISIHESQGILTFYIVNNKPILQESPLKKVGGIGLSNVRRRLDLEYANRHTLTIKDTEDEYAVELTLKLS